MTTTAESTITPEQVIDIVCQFYELDVDRMTKRIPETGRHYRSKEYVKGRQFVCYWLRKNTILSCSAVGSYFEKLDHSTVLHSVDTVIDEMNLYSRYKKEIFALNKLIQDAENKPELV